MQELRILLLALLTLSCKNSGVSPSNPDFGEMLFETEITNWAWGYQYQGKVIFQDGSLYTYNPGKDSMSVLCHADGHYTEAELRSKYAHAQVFVRTVRSDTVTLMRKLATEVRTGDFSDTTRVGADMGSWLYSVYIYRAQLVKFEQLILKLEGDWTFYNKSEAAVALADLMKRL